ncbi:MAG TPA: DUF5674 family protein [Acidobacteriota bacterium]|nr:DUF5674 family protein [Acidobacteriota bacterium]
MAAPMFGDMVKAVVDIEREIMAVDAELHSDQEALLLEKGSKQENCGASTFIRMLSPTAAGFASCRECGKLLPITLSSTTPISPPTKTGVDTSTSFCLLPEEIGERRHGAGLPPSAVRQKF